jgi:hypothetical protein
MTSPGPDAELEPFATPHDEPDPRLVRENVGASAWNWGGTDMTPRREISIDASDMKFRVQVQCHHDANGADTDEDGHLWNPAPDGDCPSSPHAYVPELPDAQRSKRLELQPLSEGQVGVEVDFSLSGDEDLHKALQDDIGTWALGCNLELVQENGPAGGAAVVRLSGPPEAVKGALIRYCGGDTAEAAHLYGPGFTDHSATVTPGNS